MGEIIFEGLPPFALPQSQTATARALDETVEMTLTVVVDDKPRPSLVQARLTPGVARILALQLLRSGAVAEANVRAKK